MASTPTQTKFYNMWHMPSRYLFKIYMPKCLSHPKLLVDHQNGASLKHSLALKVATQEKVKPQLRLVILYNLKSNN